MTKCLGIRREDKSVWERRVPVVPEDIPRLREQYDMQVVVQPSQIRVFREEEFLAAGARVDEDLSPCNVIVAVKEIPPHLILPNKTYVFFAHVIKGQPYNMPMLRRLLELGCTLIDYEKVTDDKGRRLIFFGRHAGLSGMIDTLWALGKRLEWEGIATPFAQIELAHAYRDLDSARAAIREAGERIRREGLPAGLAPLVVGFAGYGNVSRGAQEVFDELPFVELAPADLPALFAGQPDPHTLYKVVFKEEHTVKPVDPAATFELQDYYQHPEKYRSCFSDYLPYLTVLVNGIYWDRRYPRLVTKAYLREHADDLRLRVIGDISCDIEGSIECTARCTEPGNPVYVYNPRTETTTDGYAGEGVVILAVDILPSELPREASIYFSGVLRDFIPAIVAADYTVPFEQLALPPEIKRAVIVYQGKLTPDYQYISEYLTV
jgi:saccharopine dehydrogenase (NAD+, L-lysine-forming)